MSGGFPNTGLKNTALVFSVIFSSIFAKSKFNVDHSMSINTGFRLLCTIADTVVGNPTAETMISSPSFHPKYSLHAAINSKLALDPLLQKNENLLLICLPNSLSNLAQVSPEEDHFPNNSVSMAATSSLLSKYGPE